MSERTWRDEEPQEQKKSPFSLIGVLVISATFFGVMWYLGDIKSGICLGGALALAGLVVVPIAKVLHARGISEGILGLVALLFIGGLARFFYGVLAGFVY